MGKRPEAQSRKMVDEAIDYMQKYDYIKYIDNEKKYSKLLY